MRAPLPSYVCSVLFANHARAQGVTSVQWQCRRLVASLHDPYRPELHYMRGPGPKWREKNAGDARRRGPTVGIH
jgi:hypothetical protein